VPRLALSPPRKPAPRKLPVKLAAVGKIRTMLAFLRRFIPTSAAFLAAVLPLPAWAPIQSAETTPAPNADAQSGAQAQARFTQIDYAYVWRVEKPGLVPSYLFGTMHIPDQRFVKFNPTVKQMLMSVDAVYTELDMTALASAGAAIQKAGYLPRGRSIYDFLDGQDLKDLIAILLNEYSLNLRDLKQMKPFRIGLLLEQLRVTKIYPDGVPLDTHLYTQAKRASQEVGGVETIAEQVAAFQALTDAEAAHVLRKQIQLLKKDLASGRNRLQEMADLYVAGDANALYKFTQEDFDPSDRIEAKFFEAILYKRNIKMADRLTKRLTENPKLSYLFAFGTLHFIGPQSVVKKLRIKGFTVTRLTAPPAKKSIPLKKAAGF
jgi:uncharacterized protein